MYCSRYRIVCQSCPAGQTVDTVSIMSRETFARELADLHPFSLNFKALTKEHVIKKVRKDLQVCSLANIVINEQNDIMKYVEKKLETVTLLMEDADASAPVSAPTTASAPDSTAAKKTFASIMRTTQHIFVKPSDNDVVFASKTEMMNKANENLKKINVRKCRVTNKGVLVVKMSSENDRESAVSRLKEGCSNSYVVVGAKCYFQSLHV